VDSRAVPPTGSRGIGRVGPCAGKITGRACVPGRTRDRVQAVEAGISEGEAVKTRPYGGGSRENRPPQSLPPRRRGNPPMGRSWEDFGP
jgi:hypothetical protein